DAEPDVDVREVDNTTVREQQLARLAALRASRDSQRVEDALARLREGAEGDANLLELAIEATRARATVGEISDALEGVFGRHRARQFEASRVSMARPTKVTRRTRASTRQWSSSRGAKGDARVCSSSSSARTGTIVARR